MNVNIEELEAIACEELERGLALSPQSIVGPALEESIAYLSSDQSLKSLELDPYWPKWNGPWWHMLLLFELGMADRIPQIAVSKMLEVLDAHYLKFFPFIEEEIPAGRDPYRHVVCHCALGSIEQVLHACGVDVAKELPWIRPWYLKYQLPDGGLNCDEAAYTRTVAKSSIVSSLPPYEAVLKCGAAELSDRELEFLKRGANYLLERRLFRRASDGGVIDESWLHLSFPRFYHYDILRGLNFLLDWSLKTRNTLPLSAIADSVQTIHSAAMEGIIRVQRNAFHGANSWVFDEQDRTWTKKASMSYALLDLLSEPGTESIVLTAKWNEAKQALRALIKEKLILS